MADVVDSATRSRMMAGIGSRDTLPELLVRRYLHASGLRFCVHDKSLPGRPDIVLKRHQVVIFVHGCFWHRHPGCRFATTPQTRADFWASKFEANVARDARNVTAVEAAGWTALTVWECETKSEDALDLIFWRVVAASPAAPK